MNLFNLEPQLKSLHLRGMLESLENRAGQARHRKLGHLEFLELL
jgi:hypothetical protein